MQVYRSITYTYQVPKRTTITKGNLISSLFKKMQQTRNKATVQFFSDTAPSWNDLQLIVDEQSKTHGMAFSWNPDDLHDKSPSPFALKRTFGKPGEPKITLYRDHATWCPYCHKILLLLEEKRIPYNVVKINMRCYGDKPPEFLAKVPSGLLPVLEVDGQVITESAVIQQLLEKWYPVPAMLPPDGTEESSRASSLFRLERRLFSYWLQWLCNGWGATENKHAFIQTMNTIDAELGRTPGPYFLSDFSMVDIVFAPFLERITASIPYYKGFIVRGQGTWLHLERWFDAMETRPAYLAFRSDYYTHCHDLPPQLGGCVSLPEAAPMAAAIDGTDDRSWKLPLPPLSSSSLEAYSPGENPPIDRLHAAAKMVNNHRAIAKFALRGLGAPGPRPVSASLSDPTAIPNMDYEREVDAALRHVANALLSNSLDGVRVNGADDGALLEGAAVGPSLRYLRDRVGVPRDLPLPAARQLRAHLNWFIDLIEN